MQYLMTGIELHADDGFGITADSYYANAEHLRTNHFPNYDSTQQAELPQNFLYRHAIELYLKSLIIIFHRTLKIDYGSVSFDSKDPEMFTGNSWRKLYSCHFIDKLYEYWLNYLLLPNIQLLNVKASKGDWQEVKKITDLFPIICKYDQDSSYFRYPITKRNSLDSQKHTMQRFKTDTLEGFVGEIKEQRGNSRKGSFTMLHFDENDNIVDAFKHVENVLSDVRDALREIARYFHCIHIMSRMTLCNGL